MNWLSLDEEREGWKLLWRSVLVPVYVWLFVIFFLIFIAIFPNKYIFENVLSFIPYIISFRLGIITTFGALILTLYINMYSESKEWSNPQEYEHIFAYQKYATLISWFLGAVWFINFLYITWRDAKIPENIQKDFLTGVWEEGNHGKFMGFDVSLDSDIPLWVFLFMSWFILSISVHMSNNGVSIHHTIMASYKEINALHLVNNRNSDNLSKKIIKIIKYIYDDNKNWAKTILKSEEAKNIWEEVYRIFPNTSTKGYHYLVNGIRPLRKKLFIKMFIVYGIIIALHALVTTHILVNIYHMNISFGWASILSILTISIIFYILIILFWYNVFLDCLNVLMVHTKIVWVWIIPIFPGVFILMMMLIVFLYNLLSILYSYESGGEKSDGNGIFQVLLVTIIVSVVSLFTCYVILIWRCINCMNEYHRRVIVKAVFGMDLEEVSKYLNININTFIISRIIYLHMKSENVYSKYLKSTGKDEECVNNDLCEAYKVANKDRTKFPRLINIFDIFS